MTEEHDPKPYKVSVVDRETGSVRPSRKPSGADSPGDEETGDAAEVAGPDPKEAAQERVDPNKGGTPAKGVRRWHPRALGHKGQVVLLCIAVLGVVGTAVFGHAWASLDGQLGQQAQVRAVTSDFLLALTNFDAKNIDADFNRIQGYATGAFASQSNQFFGSTIRSQLEAALASSRGQIRSQYVQSINGTSASVYSVVDQTYINNKMTSPAADELQIVTDLTMKGTTWKVSNVTVTGPNNNGATSSGTMSTTSPTSTTTP